MSDTTERAREIIKTEQEAAAREMMNGMVDLVDTLSSSVEQKNREGFGESVACRYVREALCSFVASDPKFTVASPRSIRDRDREDILPGQHAGVFLQFGLKDGTILRIKFWGGLRTTSTHDFRDSLNASLKSSQIKRTENILVQRTQLNWQISSPNGPPINSWIIYDPKGFFRQDSLFIGDDKIDCHPVILPDLNNPMYQKIKAGIFVSIGKLIKLVPSSV